MAKNQYIGVGNVARKVSQPYIGVDNVARKVKTGYVGVNGVARCFYNKEYTWYKYPVNGGTYELIKTCNSETWWGDVICVDTNVSVPVVCRFENNYDDYTTVRIDATHRQYNYPSQYFEYNIAYTTKYTNRIFTTSDNTQHTINGYYFQVYTQKSLDFLFFIPGYKFVDYMYDTQNTIIGEYLQPDKYTLTLLQGGKNRNLGICIVNAWKLTSTYSVVKSSNPSEYPTNGIHTDGYWYIKQ